MYASIPSVKSVHPNLIVIYFGIGKQFVLASVLALTVQGQYNPDPRTAAIISEQRYLSGDGKFGAAYVQEDGTDFKEETDADGTRRGSYSYIDPNGQKRSISYTAGKNGLVVEKNNTFPDTFIILL